MRDERGFESAIPRASRRFVRLGEDASGPGELTGLHKRIAKLREQANQLDAFLVTRDHNGIETPVSMPILTPEEQIRVNRGKRRHLFLILLLSAIDTFLFSLIAVYFIPADAGYGSRLIFGLISALSIILCWEGGFAAVSDLCFRADLGLRTIKSFGLTRCFEDRGKQPGADTPARLRHRIPSVGHVPLQDGAFS